LENDVEEGGFSVVLGEGWGVHELEEVGVAVRAEERGGWERQGHAHVALVAPVGFRIRHRWWWRWRWRRRKWEEALTSV